MPTDVQVVREIVLPQTEPGKARRRFTFSYNSDATENFTTNLYQPACGMSYETLALTSSIGWGSLNRIVTPADAVVNYSYSLDSVNEAPLQSPDDIAAETITRKEITHDGPTGIWNYSIGYTSGRVSNPDGSFTQERYYNHSPGMAYSIGQAGLVYRSTNFNSVVERHWTNLAFSGASTASPGGLVNFNPVVDAEYTTLTDAQGNALKMSAKTFQYDYNGNVKQTTEYDWFDPSLVTRDINGVPTGVPTAATVLRTTANSHHNSPATAAATDVYAKRNHLTGTPLIINAAKETSTGPGRTQISYDGQAYGAAPTAGNITSVSSLNDGGDTDPANDVWVTVSKTYGAYGNLSSTTDARGKITNFFYEDATHAAPTRVVVDPENSTGAQTKTTAYDYATGLVTGVTDQNLQTSTINYTNQLLGVADPFSRPGMQTSPPVMINGTSQQRRVKTVYEDSLRKVTVISDLNAEHDGLHRSVTLRNRLGRTTESHQYETATDYVTVRQVYDAMGRVSQVSNPYRAPQSPVWTTTAYDLSGRVKTVTTPDNAVVTTTYDGSFVTVTDQKGKVRRSYSDGLGRLTRVDEPDANGNLGTTAAPAQPTSYTYDALGNLRQVTQGGQQRYFMYDSLSRLVRVKNPEQSVNTSLNTTDPITGNTQWSLAYSYDANGNLSQRTDAQGVVSVYTYDGLNRNTAVDYQNTPADPTNSINPDTTRSYDGATLGKGRFWFDYQGGNYSAGAQVEHRAVDGYDALGRPVTVRQMFKTNGVWSAAYTTGRTYHLTGNAQTQTYPSGRTVTYTQDTAGRLSGFTGNPGDGVARTYSTGVEYDEAGRMKSELFGTHTQLSHRRSYNVRGQMCEVGLGTPGTSNRGVLLFYYSQVNGYSGCGSGTDNNGNVVLSQHWIPNDLQVGGWQGWFNQYYTYDSLNRISSVREEQNAATTTGEQHFTYDRWGNRQINAAPTYNNNPAMPFNERQFIISTATNRLSVPGGQTGALSYDEAGNLTHDSYTGKGDRTYDAENRMTSAVTGLNRSSFYTYNATGQRVRRQNSGGAAVWQVYGVEGELLAEYTANAPATSPLKEYGYRNGELLVTAEGFSTSAAFVKTDATTGGNWKGKYGTEGYHLANDGAIYPAYAQVSATGTSNHTWAASTTDARALQKAASGNTDRIAATYYSPTEYTVNINLTDGKMHRVALYCLDWDGNNIRAQRLEVRDAATNALLDSRDVSAFSGGKYVVWNLRGHVNIKVIHTGPAGWNAAASGLFFDASPDVVQWLVSDHLGTPRMVTDQTGNLEGVKRHDYLPFGEELTAGVGGRTTQQGYSQPSGIRHGFVGYEKDGETELNFAQSRYYSPTMGRFTSPDQPLVDQWQSNPQSWNLYSYVRNNPLNLVDPVGMAAECPRGWEGCIERDGKFYWPHPETGEEFEIDDSVIVVNSADSGVPRDGGGPNLTVGEALEQQSERRTSGIINNVASGIGYGLGKVFKGLGRLFGRKPATVTVARPITGQTFERSIQTSKGPVDVLAEIVVEGDKLILKDIVIYGRGSQPLTGLTRDILAARSQLAAEAKAMGFKQLQIIGMRAQTSTSANPGHAVNILINLQ